MSRGIERGDYLAGLDAIAARGLAIAERLDRPDRESLAARARGGFRWTEALRALVDRDEPAVRAALADACRLLPELSTEPELVARRIARIAPDRRQRGEHFAAVAALWPDQRSDTALFLRALALGYAVRGRTARHALRLAAGWPWTATPSFLLRRRSAWLELGQAALQRRAHRGREAPTV
jgi:hypothetical protein